MWNAALDESQAGTKLAGRNISNLIYSDDPTLMAEKWRGTKAPLDKGQGGQWKASLKLSKKKKKINIMASGAITTWKVEGWKVEALTDSLFSGSKVPKPLTVWITINCGKFWKRWEYQTTWPASWEICMQVRKQQLELVMEQQTGSK